MPSFQWLYVRLRDYCLSTNKKKNWGLTLDTHWTRNRKFHNDIRLVTYGIGDYYNLHRDEESTNSLEMKKACSTILFLKSESSDRSGGELLFHVNNTETVPTGHSFQPPHVAGVLLTFRSDKVFYEVTSLSEGYRKMLVWWIPGISEKI
eukprot:TRINITY_DN1275_c0_g1_i10.p1 TRINITY_DN1275_c0_g1~~TRINITY_DN1275_c0_g1_i10.p1  ORF type:complete len:149 (-),score=28.88 TRINITY_DN1275_c0_g1_i10:231-677(-)